VFPKSQYRPSDIPKTFVRVGIPDTVLFDLLPPEIRLLLRPCRVFGTSMPETSIDEDSNHLPRKSDVGDPARFPHYLEIDSVPQASPVQLSTQCDLSTCSCLPDLRHSATGFWR
jgi:hypothetical protein